MTKRYTEISINKKLLNSRVLNTVSSDPTLEDHEVNATSDYIECIYLPDLTIDNIRDKIDRFVVGARIDDSGWVDNVIDHELSADDRLFNSYIMGAIFNLTVESIENSTDKPINELNKRLTINSIVDLGDSYSLFLDISEPLSEE